MLEIIPSARVGHVGLYRDEETLQPVQYYFKLPVDAADGEVIIVDPAFATGVSADATIKLLKDAGCKRIKFMCIFSCDQGIEFVHSRHPDVPIYAAYHSTYPLNEKGYKVPEDVSVTGFDNYLTRHTTSVPLTTVSINPQDTANVAADLIIKKINGESSRGPGHSRRAQG